MKIEKNTKIIATIGPATQEISQISKLVDAGMDVVRLNFSHGNYESMLQIINNVRKVAKEKGKSIPIIQDLQGPKIRVGILPDEGIELIKDKTYTFVSGEKYDGKNIPIPVKEVIKEIAVNDNLLLADGYLKVKVTKKIQNGFEAKVIYGGILKSRKGIICENKTFSLSSLTKKDYEDIDWGYKNNVNFEYIAFSFVKSAKDVHTLRDYLKKKHNDTSTKIITKFETAKAVQNMEEIIKASDAIMVARGDLGLEVPIQHLAIIQKKLVKLCRQYYKPVIIATQMLSSMMTNPIPNRSEVSDITNAVFDKTDAVMLSDETAVGKNAIESVQMFSKIILEAEKEQKTKRLNDLVFLQTHTSDETAYNVAKSALYLAHSINAKRIIICSYQGYTAKVFTSFRSFIPITVVTDKEIVEKQSRLVWALNDILVVDKLSLENTIQKIYNLYKFKKDDKIIICNMHVSTNTQFNKIKEDNVIKVITF